MSAELFDVNGPVGNIATSSGLGDARRVVEKMKGLEALKGLFMSGVTKKPQQASAQALAVSRLVKDNQIRNVLVNISRLLNEAESIAIIQV